MTKEESIFSSSFLSFPSQLSFSLANVKKKKKSESVFILVYFRLASRSPRQVRVYNAGEYHFLGINNFPGLEIGAAELVCI